MSGILVWNILQAEQIRRLCGYCVKEMLKLACWPARLGTEMYLSLRDVCRGTWQPKLSHMLTGVRHSLCWLPSVCPWNCVKQVKSGFQICLNSVPDLAWYQTESTIAPFPHSISQLGGVGRFFWPLFPVSLACVCLHSQDFILFFLPLLLDGLPQNVADCLTTFCSFCVFMLPSAMNSGLYLPISQKISLFFQA